MEDKEIQQLDESIQQLNQKMKELQEEREKLLELKMKSQLDHKPLAEQKVAELKVLEKLNVEEAYISSMNKEADPGLDGIAGEEEKKMMKKKKKRRNKKKKKKKEPSMEEDCMAAIGSRHEDSNDDESNCKWKALSEQKKEETKKVVQDLSGGLTSGGIEDKSVKQESGHKKIQEALKNLNLDTIGVDEPILKFAVGSGSGCTVNKRRMKKNYVKPRIAHTRDKNIRQLDDASTSVGVEATGDSNEVTDQRKLKIELTQILKIGLTKMLAVNSSVQGDAKITTGARAYATYQEKMKKKNKKQ